MAEWRQSSNGFVPSEGVAGGNDINGELIYVGRAYESGDLIPGKIVPSHGVLYVAYDGRERSHREYEYLVRPNYGSLKWVPAADGDIPCGAIVAGNTAGGEPLFVGRAYYEGSWVIGKVQKSHRVLYIPFDTKEISISDYELLTATY